jgi:hypothetical protein
MSKRMGVSIGYVPTPQTIGSPMNAANLARTAIPSAPTQPAAPVSVLDQAKLQALAKKKLRYQSGGSNRTGNYTTSGTYGSAGSVSRSSGLGSMRK